MRRSPFAVGMIEAGITETSMTETSALNAENAVAESTVETDRTFARTTEVTGAAGTGQASATPAPATPAKPSDLDELRAKIGVAVPDDLLELALTHPSVLGEGEERVFKSNQRLEFLGDVVVALVVAEHLYRGDATLPEGILTQRKAAAVRGSSLASAARRLGLGAYLRLGRGEEVSGGRKRETILADAFEALLAAIFLSCGLDEVRAFVLRALDAEIAAVAQNAVNVKNLLQERTQAVGLGTPRYQSTETGRDKSGAPLFTSQVLLDDGVRGAGTGRTKKEAEQNAAAVALEEMMKDAPQHE
jgi:ribonuclease-3